MQEAWAGGIDTALFLEDLTIWSCVISVVVRCVDGELGCCAVRDPGACSHDGRVAARLGIDVAIAAV